MKFVYTENKRTYVRTVREKFHQLSKTMRTHHHRLAGKVCIQMRREIRTVKQQNQMLI